MLTSLKAIIVLLLLGLVLTIPVAIVIFVYNLKSGFRAVDDDCVDGGVIETTTLELPPEIDRGETTIFKSDPNRTLDAIQTELETTGGRLDLRKRVDYSAEEFEVKKCSVYNQYLASNFRRTTQL